MSNGSVYIVTDRPHFAGWPGIDIQQEVVAVAEVGAGYLRPGGAVPAQHECPIWIGRIEISSHGPNLGRRYRRDAYELVVPRARVRHGHTVPTDAVPMHRQRAIVIT